MKLLSFVIPCYRSEKTIEKVVGEIISTVAERKEYDYEIICVNDCSPDNVYDVLKKLAADNRKIKVINFVRNMGKPAAVLAGYSVVKGEYVVNLDDDYQCPTYELWKLIEPLENDECDVTSAIYYDKKESKVKRAGSRVNSKMTEILINKPKDVYLDNFYAMKRFVADEMVKYKHAFPYIYGLILRVTHRIQNIYMEQRERSDGNKSGYTFLKSAKMLLNGLTAFSVKPLRIATVCGFVFALIGFVYGIVIVIKKIVISSAPLGYSSLMVVLLVAAGIIMMILGLIGEYLGRIYICINASPQYIIRNTINLDEAETSEEKKLWKSNGLKAGD